VRTAAGRVDIARDVDCKSSAGSAGRAFQPDRPATEGGGPEGKLRGRPPPPVEPRSGPWRRTGS